MSGCYWLPDICQIVEQQFLENYQKILFINSIAEFWPLMSPHLMSPGLNNLQYTLYQDVNGTTINCRIKDFKKKGFLMISLSIFFCDLWAPAGFSLKNYKFSINRRAEWSLPLFLAICLLMKKSSVKYLELSVTLYSVFLQLLILYS